jgi:hypothetical protein
MVWFGRFVYLAVILSCATLMIWSVNDIIPNAQSWVTAIGVIVAAFFAYWQQYKIDERETTQRKRKGVAARAVMPAALAEICEYAEQSAETVTERYPRGAGFSSWALLVGSVPVPNFPSESIKALRDCIEYAEGADTARIADCIRKLQIQHSRLSKFLLRSHDKALMQYEFDSILTDTIELHAYCSSLFPYARGEEISATVRPCEELIRSSASYCNIYANNFHSVFDYMSLRGLIT